MGTPTHITTKEVSVQDRAGGHQTLPSGSFVQPINVYYIPKFLKDKHPLLDQKTHCFCYTHYGIVVLARSEFRKV